MNICSYGVNFQRIDDDLLICGIVLRDYPGTPTQARRKMLRAMKRSLVDLADLDRVVATAKASTKALEDDMRDAKEAILTDYRASGQYQQDVVDLLRPELEQTLAQVHDYKQFVQQILQNLDVALEDRFPELPLEEKIDQATDPEAAIYWSARLMDEKLDAALFFLYPDSIHKPNDRRRFSFHGLVTKYVKIYQSQVASNSLTLRVAGESWCQVEGNPGAIGIIPHTLVDNAVKYAPEGTTVKLIFKDTDESVSFAVESFGPIIHPEERQQIFNLFYRGKETHGTGGTGFGLASAHNVASQLGIEIDVRQYDEDRGPDDTRRTRFSVTIPRVTTKTGPKR